MAADRVTGLPFDVVERALELGIGERLDRAALLANHVVVVLAAGVHRLEARRSGAEVDPLHEAVAAQLLERPVDARDPDPPSLAAELVEDLLRRQAAVLPTEQLDYGTPGAPVAVPLRAQ